MTDAELIALAQALVRIPSVSGNERPVAEYLAGAIAPIFDTVRVDGHGNVIAELGGSRPGPTILLNGHLDVVDAGEMPDAWSGAVVDGGPWGSSGLVLYGRGASDMKGPSRTSSTPCGSAWSCPHTCCPPITRPWTS